jgi:hypothetical protein
MKKNLLLLTLAVLFNSCSDDVISTPPPPTQQTTEVENLKFDISYPSSWNMEEESLLNIEVFTNRKNPQMLFSWRRPNGEEVSRSSFITREQAMGLSRVMAYVTLIDVDGMSFVRKTSEIEVIDEAPKKLRVTVTRIGNQFFAVAVPLRMWEENNIMGNDFWMMGYAIEPIINKYGYYEEYDSPEWEMEFMASIFRDVDEDSYDNIMSTEEILFEEKERMKKELRANRSNVLHYEWYIDDTRIPADHYLVDVPADFQGQIRLVVYGQNWELLETILE